MIFDVLSNLIAEILLILLTAFFTLVKRLLAKRERCSLIWSPNSNRICFVSDKWDNREIYIIDVATSTILWSTNHPVDDCTPVWSFDSSKIAFASTRDRNRTLYVVDANDSNLRKLTDHVADDNFPIWSPDGSRIACICKEGKETEIRIFDVSSTPTEQQPTGQNRSSAASDPSRSDLPK